MMEGDINIVTFKCHNVAVGKSKYSSQLHIYIYIPIWARKTLSIGINYYTLIVLGTHKIRLWKARIYLKQSYYQWWWRGRRHRCCRPFTESSRSARCRYSDICRRTSCRVSTINSPSDESNYLYIAKIFIQFTTSFDGLRQHKRFHLIASTFSSYSK